MADEPENFLHRILRDMRSDANDFHARMDAFQADTRTNFRDIRRKLDEHTMHFESLEERFDMLREGTLGAIRFASNADRQFRAMQEQIAELAKRVEGLEKAK